MRAARFLAVPFILGKIGPHSSRLTTLRCLSAGIERGLDAGPLQARRLPCINVVLHFNRLTGEFKHSFLEFSIGQRKALMLSLVFSPRINLKIL
jgi:hypothetical protein